MKYLKVSKFENFTRGEVLVNNDLHFSLFFVLSCIGYFSGPFYLSFLEFDNHFEKSTVD